MLVANVLFRMGGAAVLLAKHPRAVGRRPAARYAVTHMVRVHLGADEEAYRSVFQDADREGQVGVRLDKNLMQVARRGLERNLRILAPQVLPLHEKLRYALREGLRRWKVYRYVHTHARTYIYV
jgi:3-ketoacyl-CoA synthase